MNKKFIIMGFPRSGTHRVKEFIDYNLKKKSFKRKKDEKFYIKKIIKNVFIKKKYFYKYDLTLPSKYKITNIKTLKKKNVLSTHFFYNKLMSDFKNFNIILTIRDPISVIHSIINYTTKDFILKYNPQYKIKSPFCLMSERKIINNYIQDYNKFYSKFLTTKYSRFLNKFIIVDYKTKLNKKFQQFSFKSNKIKKSALHSSKKSIIITNYLINNYNFKKSLKVYFLLKKFC